MNYIIDFGVASVFPYGSATVKAVNGRILDGGATNAFVRKVEFGTKPEGYRNAKTLVIELKTQ